MSIFKIIYEGTNFDIEIARDGELFFLDYDIELDLIREELGESTTAALKLADEWIKDPIQTILLRFGLSRQSVLLLAADWVEHVLRFFEEEVPDDRRLRDVISAIRKFANGKMKYSTLKKYRKAAKDVMDTVRIWDLSAFNVADAVESVARSVMVGQTGAWDDRVDAAERRAAWSAAYHASPDNSSPEWKAAKAEEVVWQVRRSGDCIEALQSGKSWPKLKVTK